MIAGATGHRALGSTHAGAWTVLQAPPSSCEIADARPWIFCYGAWRICAGSFAVSAVATCSRRTQRGSGRCAGQAAEVLGFACSCGNGAG